LTTDQSNIKLYIYLVLDDAKTSLHHIEHANRNLIDATKLNEKLGFCWAFLYFGMAFFLIFYDFINSWKKFNTIYIHKVKFNCSLNIMISHTLNSGGGNNLKY
jgi:hypothetical protein